jgi:lysine biosynthesis enzyme LysX
MKLGLMINRVNFEEKQIIKACEKQGIDPIQFNNQRISFDIAHQKNLTPEVDIILQRSLSLTRALYSTAILESKGYTVVNNYECIYRSGDKLLTSLDLAKNGIPTPKTGVAFTPEAAEEAIKSTMPYPIITKPVIGSWGRMVARINDIDALRAIYEVRENLGDAFQKIYYFQEYVDATKVRKDAPTDIRVFYIGGNVVAAMGRYHAADEFRSNIAIGGSAKPYPMSSELEKLTKKIAKVFHGEILGIDFIETETGYTCIEVNGTPGFEGLVHATNVNIGELIVDYLKKTYA